MYCMRRIKSWWLFLAKLINHLELHQTICDHQLFKRHTAKYNGYQYFQLNLTTHMPVLSCDLYSTFCSYRCTTCNVHSSYRGVSSTTDGGVWSMHFLYGPTRSLFYQRISYRLTTAAYCISAHSTSATGVDTLARDPQASELK